MQSSQIKNEVSKECYFLTGAAGFVGSNLLESLLNDRQEVHVLLKRNSNLWRIQHLLNQPLLHVHYGSLVQAAKVTHLLQQIQPTVIYHLAARGAYAHQNNAWEIFETNVFGTLNLLEAVKNLTIKLFINTSSSSEYGAKTKPMKEKDLLEPDSFYAVSKVSATLLCQSYATEYHLPTVTLRLFSVYGPWEEPSRLMPNLLSSLKAEKDLDMVSPDTARDFIYINDVVSLYRQVELLSAQAGQVFNVGTGIQTTLKEVTEIAQAVTQKKIQFHWQKMTAKSWDKSNWVADMSHTRKVLGWQPKYELSEGLSLMWDWQDKHDQFYKSV